MTQMHNLLMPLVLLDLKRLTDFLHYEIFGVRGADAVDVVADTAFAVEVFNDLVYSLCSNSSVTLPQEQQWSTRRRALMFEMEGKRERGRTDREFSSL